MPEVNIKLPEVPDNPWKDTQFAFNGRWIPDVDGALIGPNNYQTLQNLRYTDSGLEGVAGYTKINVDPPATNQTLMNSGYQLRSSHTQSSYILVHTSHTTSGAGRIYNHLSVPDAAGTDFDDAGYFNYSNGDAFFQDASANLTGRFSDAPQGNIAYCNSEESMIYSGNENRIAAAFTYGGTDLTHATYKWTAAAAGANWWYCELAAGGDPGFTNGIGLRYDDGSGRDGLIDGVVGSTTNRSWWFGDGAGDTLGFETFYIRIDGVIDPNSLTATDKIRGSWETEIVDVSQRLNNRLSTTNEIVNVDVTGDNTHGVLVVTTRPINGLSIKVTANVNTVISDTKIKTWNGTRWIYTHGVASDKTSDASISLKQDGFIRLDSYSVSKLRHIEELYLYAYAVDLSDGEVDLYNTTASMMFAPVRDVWDGVYRQPIQFQVYKNATATYEDYTLQVNESSDINAPIGAKLAGSVAADKFYIMFEDQAAAIRFTMLGGYVNETAACVLSVKYWNGTGYTALTIKDGTGDTSTFSKSGLVEWTPPTDEIPRTLFGSFGYVYEFSHTGTFAGPTVGGVEQLWVDVCTGVPEQFDVRPFDFPVIYGTRLMLGGFTKGDEGNRMDYSVANAPDAFNGFDSSDNGKQSLYFGGVQSIVGATQIYNRFGSSIYSMLLVLKKNETYILVGSTPEDFIIYDVANTIGCVAPQTIATAEVGLDLGNGLTRNVAIWLSHSGPMMFDGAILTPIPGIRSYFDPTDAKYIKFSLIEKARGWVDPNYKEYNLVIPSGPTSTDNDTWLVYDLVRRKWFTKDTGSSLTPQMGFKVGDPDTGQRYVYGGINSGHMVHLEEGYTWGDDTNSGITQKVKTGDFFPSGSIWDETLIRKLKLYLKKLTDTTAENTLEVFYYTNTEENPGSGVVWESSSVASGLAVDWYDGEVEWLSPPESTVNINLDIGLQRLIKVVNDLNLKGWAHAFEFELTTTDVAKGFQPIAWGVQYRIERKDDTAT